MIFRFKQLKEQEARRRQQREGEKRKAEEAALQQENGELKNEVNLVEPGLEAENTVTDTCNTFNNEHRVVNGTTSPRTKDDTRTTDGSGSHEDETIGQEPYGTTEKVKIFGMSFQYLFVAWCESVIQHSTPHFILFSPAFFS